jgi:two-component system chemotaxis response regulator CheY
MALHSWSAAASSSGGEDASSVNDPNKVAAEKLMVLVVEDDEPLRSALCEALEDNGFRAIPAQNGLHALAQLQELQKPNLIILDLMMPVMNGWDFHAHLKANPNLASVPVLLLSAYVQRDSHTWPKDVEGALQKPVAVNDLLAWVRRLAVRLKR